MFDKINIVWYTLYRKVGREQRVFVGVGIMEASRRRLYTIKWPEELAEVCKGSLFTIIIIEYENGWVHVEYDGYPSYYSNPGRDKRVNRMYYPKDWTAAVKMVERYLAKKGLTERAAIFDT